MMKRIIALLLALILTVGLLPTVALAADGENPTTDSGSVTKEASKDNLNLVKTVTKEGDNYKVTLESWATGTVTSSSTPVPMDIILLLDQSGSMNSDFTSSSSVEYNRLYKRNQKIYEDYRDRLYIYDGSGYVKVSVEKETILFSKDKFTYTWSGGSYVSYGERDYPDMTFYYQSTNSSKTTKIVALKSAVRSFIGKVNEEATSKNVEHRVAIVGFASTKSGKKYKNTELLSTQNEVNYANANASNYEDALVSAKTEKKRLSTAIDRLDANGDTYPEYGFDMANKIFAQHPIQAGDNRQRVVIMFTDGYPAPAGTDDFNVQMANNAINNAKRCKDNNAKVYTIGIFDGADPSASIENYSQNGWLNEAVAANRYMHFSSSNYPSAMALNNGGTKGEGNFYFAASNADALNDIFDTISEEISTDTTTLDGSATIVDNIPGNFTIPAEASDIKVYTAKCAGKTNGTLTWESRESSTLQASSATENGKTSVSVTGFNYSDKWCGLDENNDPHGSKLIIEFTISHNNYGGTQPTNAGASIKDEENKDVITVDNPSVPVTISKPNDIFASAIEKTYDGTGFDILNKVAEKANSLANGTNNKFVDIEVKVTVDSTDYIYTILAGQTAGTWNQAGTPKTSPNVKATTLGTAENYEYPVTITFKDAAKGSTASNSTETKAKFKINYAEVTVKANDKSKKTTEDDPTTFDATVTGMINGEKAEDKLNYTISRTDAQDNTVGDHKTITPSGDTYQNNYKVTYETGTLTITQGDPTATELSLTGKFQKTLNSNTANVPRKPFELTITGTSDNTDKTAISGTADIGTLTKQGDKYTGSAYFGFSSALKFSTDGTYKYKVQETKGNVAGMSYDTTAYELVIEVENKNGALEIKSATIGETDMKNAGPFTITNTFTAAELPLDPTTDPTTGEVTPKIVKKLRVTSGSAAPTADLPFTVAVYEGNAVDEAKRVATGTATIPANSPDETTVNFTGLATLVFPEAGRFTYTIHEDTGSTSGVRYDGYLYTMTVEVTKNTSDNSLSATCSFSYPLGEETVVANSITITNTYAEPKNAQVTNKEVVVTQPEDGLKTAVNAFKITSGVTVLYPTGNGTTSNTLEVPYGTTKATLLYKITVYAGTQSDYTFEDKAASFVYAENAKTVTKNGDYFTVTFEDGAEYAYVYVAVTHVLKFTNDFCEVLNSVVGHEAKTTVTEKAPNSATVDFSQLVYKKLTVTGDKAFTGATFEAVLDGEWHDLPTALSLEDASAIATYAHATPGAAQLHKTLTVSFDANDDLTQNKAFTGSITFNAEGVYTYTLKEVIPEGATGYDTSEFLIQLWIKANSDAKLEVKSVKIKYNNQWEDLNGIILFENTIDTGRDDYIPIIIPTIINKDTGMLNKTDHFAYVIGYPDGTVHPNGQITRAEVATIFFRLLRDEVRDGAFTTSNTYSDVAYGKWYNNPISTMSALGIITGYPDGTFKPNKPITRAEFAAIAARFDETQSGKSATFSDVIGHWAAKEIGIAYYNDWIKGYPDGTFKPDQNITRAEAMTLINRVLERKPESPADLLTNMNKWTDNLDTSKWYYLDVQEATNSHGYTRKTFNYELWRQMLPDPDWSRYER